MSQEHPESSGNARRALVVFGQPIVVGLIQLTLSHGLFTVRAVDGFDEAEAVLINWQPHLAILDLDHDDSTEVLQVLRKRGSAQRHVTPVLGLARRGDLATKLRAFDLGVDDILTVPFSPEELLARSIVITRRSIGIDLPIVPTIRLGEISIDIVNREARTGNSIIHLSSIEQALLYLLASRSGQVTTREEILDTVWGTDFVAESNVVDRHIRSLRLKLQDDYRRPRFIATVSGQGYRFIPTFTSDGWVGGTDEGLIP
jgi:DNA-binding response OmpR family regulator